LEEPVAIEPPRQGEDAASCESCNAPDDAYIWVNERWRVRAMERPSGLPMVLILEARSHLDLGDLPNLLAAELGVMTVRLERAIRSLDGVARVHVNRWGDGSPHLHLWFLARPAGRLQLRGSFLSMWDDILPPVDESTWRENLALVAAWLAEFGGRALAEPPRIDWQAPSTLAASQAAQAAEAAQAAQAAEAAQAAQAAEAARVAHAAAAARAAKAAEAAEAAQFDGSEPEQNKVAEAAADRDEVADEEAGTGDQPATQTGSGKPARSNPAQIPAQDAGAPAERDAGVARAEDEEQATADV